MCCCKTAALHFYHANLGTKTQWRSSYILHASSTMLKTSGRASGRHEYSFGAHSVSQYMTEATLTIQVSMPNSDCLQRSDGSHYNLNVKPSDSSVSMW